MENNLITTTNGAFGQGVAVDVQPVVIEQHEAGFIAKLNGDKKVSLCTMVAETMEEKAKLFNAMNNPEKRVSDCINETIWVKDIFGEEVTCVNEQTGEQKQCPRIVLIDTEGVGYSCVSTGVFNSLLKVFEVFGRPTYEEGLPLKIKQITKGQNKITTLEVNFKATR